MAVNFLPSKSEARKMVVGQHLCCTKRKVKRGLWSLEEDQKLVKYISERSGRHGSWSSLPERAGLKRCGKSCRLRWINYLRPDVKRGNFSTGEANLILRLHKIYGNRWAEIAKNLPGRTDNEVKNFFNSNIKKQLLSQQNQQQNSSGIFLFNDPNYVINNAFHQQQQFHMNLYKMFEQTFYDSASDRLINESQHTLAPVSSNGKGKEVAIDRDVADENSLTQPPDDQMSLNAMVESFFASSSSSSQI